MKQTLEPFNIATANSFDLSHGFLPSQDPVQQLPSDFSAWEALANELPKLLTSNQTRERIKNLPPFKMQQLKTLADYERAMLILSYLGHAYVWNNAQAIDRIPHVLAQPWYDVGQKLGRPPVLSYATYALYNWRRLDKKKPIELGNIVLMQNFLGGLDEEWFILIHVDIEAKAASALNAMLPAITAANTKNESELLECLEGMKDSLNLMCNSLDRMPEACDPYIYFNRVRPYIHGWKDNPALPNGLIYEGVEGYGNKPQFFKGETGAQSTIIPAFDATLGVTHQETPLKKHLDEMRLYMPPQHRAFLEALEKQSTVREFILKTSEQRLRDVYNECIELIVRFRKTHIHYAAHYIQKQSQVSITNPTQVGTGGTPFMAYLREHLHETESHRV